MSKGFQDAEIRFRRRREVLQTDGAADGLIFIQFVSLMLRCELMNRIKENRDTNGKLWYPDMMNELSKLKASKMGDKWMLNEVSRKQRLLFENLVSTYQRPLISKPLLPNLKRTWNISDVVW